MQFNRDILCLASISDSRIEVWRIATNDNPQPVLLGQLACHDDSSNFCHITCLKLQAMNHSQYRLVAGYDDGGFSLWTMEIKDHPTSFVARQLTHYTPPYRLGSHQAIEAIGLSYPMVLICTKGMKLSAFCIDDEQAALSPRLVYELQSPIRWNPIVVELDQCDHNRWRGMACFGMPVGLNAFSVGIQVCVTGFMKLCTPHANPLLLLSLGSGVFIKWYHIIKALYSIERGRFLFYQSRTTTLPRCTRANHCPCLFTALSHDSTRQQYHQAISRASFQ